MKIYLIGAIAFLFLAIPKALSQSETVAVLPFESVGVDTTTGSAVTEFVQEALTHRDVYRVLERQQIRKILREQKFEATGVTADAVEIGKLLSVNKLIVGSVSKLGKSYTLIMRIVDVKTGEVVKSDKRSAQIPIEDIDNVLVGPMVEGLLSVKKQSGFTLVILSAIGLPSMDVMSKSDPWIQVLVGNKLIGRTRVIQDDNSPQFNERFDVPDYAGEPIVLNVYDHDVTKDQIIGSVTISSPKSGKYPIVGVVNGQALNRGQVEVSFQ